MMNDTFPQILQGDGSHIQRKWLDLHYATFSGAQKLDIYLPEEGDGPFPVVLHIHGGAFAFGDKRDIHLMPYLQGLQREYAVVSVNYRLSGEAIFPAGLQDLKASIRWLRANQECYHLDGNRIAACGGSAGGNYAAMLCLTPDKSELDDISLGNSEYSCTVQAAVDMFGPTDFLKMDDQLAESGLGPSDHSDADSPEFEVYGGKNHRNPFKSPTSESDDLYPPEYASHSNSTWAQGSPGACPAIHYFRREVG